MAKNTKKKPSYAGFPQSGKHPGYITAPPEGKNPVAVPVPWRDDNPSWRIAKLELLGPYGWMEVDAGKLLDIRQKLANYESMTWKEILKDHDHNHDVAVHRIESDARKRLDAIGLGTLEEIFRLRLTGTERVWGLRIGSVLHIIWWDPDHQICKSKKKHT